jgi:DNA-binding NtrC family response regulator
MVVVIDDSDDSLIALKEIIGDSGLEVAAFNNPMEALKFVEQNKGVVEVCVVDYVMPEMNGEVVSRRIREFDKDIFIMLMSGYVDFDRVQPLLKERLFYQFFTKPLDFDRLLRTIDTAIKLYLKKQALS